MKKKELEKIEKALEEQHYRDLRRKNNVEYFKNTTTHHLEWFRNLIGVYKERGVFPIMPSLITEYYTNRRDKEAALLITMCVKWGGDSAFNHVQDLKKILGESPYLWLRKGGYKSLALPRNQEGIIEGSRSTRYWKISHIASYLNNLCKGEDGFLPFEEAFTKENLLPKVVDEISVYFSLGEKYYRGRLMDMTFRTNDGIGKGLWSIPDGYQLLCPYSRDIGQFLKTWFPSYFGKENLFTFDEAVSVFGLERDYDFFYAYLAWKELCKRNPEECKKYVSKYSDWYGNGTIKRPCQWRKVQPEISF